MPALNKAQKELVLLWSLLAMNNECNPGQTTGAGQTYATPADLEAFILNKILTDFHAAAGNATWNFTNLGLPVAKAIIAKEVSAAYGPSFNIVSSGFRFAAMMLPSAGGVNPWPDNLPNHPSVAELKAALGL